MTDHVPLARAMARRYVRLGLDHDDLVQEAILGLMDAAERFDPERGVRFATYARHRVRFRLQRFVRESRAMVSLPRTRAIRRVRRRLRRVTAELEAAHGERVTPEAIAEALEVDLTSVELVLADLGCRDLPVDDLPGATPDDDRTRDPEALVARTQLRELAEGLIRSVWDRLEERDRAIVHSRHLTENPPSFRELGERLSISGERVRQLERRALRRLREALRDTGALSRAESCVAGLAA